MKKTTTIATALFMLVALYIAHLYNYLFFHSLAEVFSITIACGIFMVTWNSRRYLENQYILFIGIGYLFVALLDILHTFSYKGMNILPVLSADTATQLWIAARYLESLTLLCAPLMFHRRIRPRIMVLGYGSVVTVVLLAIFYWRIFPHCYLEGAGGLTPFKKISEYVICTFLLATSGVTYHYRNQMDPGVHRWLQMGIGTTIVAELLFTTYASVFGLSNMLGHYFKIISFYCIYEAIIVTALGRPYELLFRELKLSKERYKWLFDHLINGFSNQRIVYDRDGKPVDYIFLEVNRAFKRITGLTDVVGKRATEVIPGIQDDPADWIGSYAGVVDTGKSIMMDNYMEKLDKWFSVSAYRTGVDQFATIFEDITHRIRNEAALRQANEVLESKVRERTASLKRMVSNLEAEIELRRQAETEIKQANQQLAERADQLRALTGELAMAERRERMRLSKVLHDGLQQQLAAIKLQLGNFIDQVEGDQLQNTVRDLESMVGESIQISRSLAAELSPPVLHQGGLEAGLKWLVGWMRDKHGFNVDLAVGSSAELSEDVNILVFESIRELLFNAVKHAKVSSARLQLQKEGDAGVRITVSDQGAGFDTSCLAAAGENGGGFGLFSIRERIGLIGGCLEMESAPGRGSCFTLTVPCAPEERTPADAGPHPDPSGMACEAAVEVKPLSAARVIIADDHQLFRDAVARLLDREADICIVAQAGNGREAIDLCRKMMPDVILMDISMPDINGIEATRQIHDQWPHIRIIGLSMHEGKEHAHIMQEAGAVGYKNKGCPASELVDAIRACLAVDEGWPVSRPQLQ